jgi:hypothetical protein
VNWALAQAPAAVRPIIERHLRELADDCFESLGNTDAPGRARYGLLCDEQSSEIRSRALGEIVRPCASLLLSAAQTGKAKAVPKSARTIS